MDSIISVENVTFAYEKKNVLKDINLNINDGEFVTILGHNGSGKSTLVKLINGLITPSKGTVLVGGLDTKDEKTIWEVRRTCGMVFQNPDNQLIATSVEEDVAFGLENLGVDPNEMDDRIEYALKSVSMAEYRKNQPHMLSGGQKQRVAIAGILAMKPKVILLDEATAMLDPKGRKEVMDILHHLNRDMGMTIVHVTHHMEEALLGGRCIVMSDGGVVMDGEPLDVFYDDRIEELSLETPPIIRLTKALGINMNGQFNYEEVLERICQLK